MIQFSKPGYSRQLYDRVNGFCREFGVNVQVRFFGYGWQTFDAAILDHFPDVANLSLDTLESITDITPLARLTKLRCLRFGIFRFADADLLKCLDLSNMTQLGLIANDRRNLNLAPLATARNLESLFIQGHSKGIGSICSLPRLNAVSLSGFPKKHDLAFLNALEALRSVRLILGTRASINEFTHDALRSLEIIWVKTLETLGDLSRFPALEELSVEDEIRITTLDLSGTHLRKLKLQNCKNLNQLVGLASQDRLSDVSVWRTKLGVSGKIPLSTLLEAGLV